MYLIKRLAYSALISLAVFGSVPNLFAQAPTSPQPVNVPTPGAALPNFTLPSANATALGTYGQYGLSYASGTPDISIPIYTVQSSKLSLPISLNCHANGIKVTEQATTVGLGWSLNAGGVITHQINDLDDFFPTGYKYKPIPPAVHSSPPIGSSPATLDSMTDEQRFYYGKVSAQFLPKGNQKYDGAPDDYMYNFAGKSGRFILKNVLDSAMAPSFMTIPYSPLNVTCDPSGSFFTLTDQDGTKYIFGKSVKDGSLAYEYTSTEGNASTTAPCLTCNPQQPIEPSASGYDPITHNTAFYLTEIISADFSDTISIKYASEFSTPQVVNYYGYSTADYTPQAPYGYPQGHISGNTQSKTSITSFLMNISEIDFKNGKVVFEYASRSDLGVNRLNRIRIYQGGGSQLTELKRFDFYQSYYTGDSPSSNSQMTVNADNQGVYEAILNQRLRLDSLKEEGVNADGSSLFKPPYRFNYYYYSPDGPSTGYIAYLGDRGQDLWGYWNGATNANLVIHDGTSTVQANRVPDSLHMIAGTIKSIQYPTKGTTEFQYETNQTYRTYTTSDTSYNSYNLSTVGTYGVPSTDVTFTASSSTTASFTFTATNANCSVNCIINQQAEVYLIDQSTGKTILNYYDDPFTDNYSMSNNNVQIVGGDTYHLYFLYPPGYVSGQSPKYNLHAGLSHAGIFNIIVTPHKDLVRTGGLRIKKIINHDANNATLTTKTFNYKLPYYISGIFTGNFASVGQGYSFQSYLFAAGVSWFKDYFTTNLIPWCKGFTENFTVSLGGATDGAQAYQEVEELQTDSLGSPIGKTVYDFNKIQDDTTDVFSTVRINNAWRRNQVVETRNYKSSGTSFVLIKDVLNTYTDLFPASQDTALAVTVHRIYNPGDAGTENESTENYLISLPIESNINGGSIFMSNLYHVSIIPEIDFRNALTSTSTTDYDLNGANPITTTYNYFYNNPQHMMVSRVETLKSNQDKSIVRALYTTDYAVDACNAGAYLTSLKSTLATLKNHFLSISYPINVQWRNYVFRWFNIYGHCFYLSGQVPLSQSQAEQCWNSNGLDTYDSNITSLYYQYEGLKNTYLDSVHTAVANYTVNLNTYATCYNNQKNASPDSIKALLIMQQNNQLSPVEKDESWADHTSGTEYMISATKASYTSTSAQTAQIGKTLSSLFIGSIPYTTYTASPTSYLYFDQNYDSYDASGNLTSYHTKKGPTESLIWGYNHQYPIAQVTNTGPSQIAYTSFEDGTATSGNWNFTASGLTSTIMAPVSTIRAGKNMYKIASGNVTTTSSMAAGTYVVSYWATAALTVNSTVPTITGDLDTHGWQYFEHKVTLATPALITVSGTGTTLLDELRLYPVGSQMTSYTYNPLVGITSTEGKDGHNQFFEYDGLQRLSISRDDHSNILKEYKYNYEK